MVRRKKSPSIKIPAAVLRREAEKMARKIRIADNKKEKRREMRERAKVRATKKVSKQRVQTEQWESFVTDSVKREIMGGVWIVLAILLFVLFWGTTEFSQATLSFFKTIFGIGTWIVPLGMIGGGVFLFIDRDTLFPPARILSFLLFFVSLLGLVNLFVPHADSLALSPSYGGALGFAIGFFPREFLGTVPTIIILLGVLWVSSVLGFGIRISHLLRGKHLKQIDIEKAGRTIETRPTRESKKEKEAATSRFKNELKIIDSTTNGKSGKSTVQLDKSDELTAAKNRELGGQWEPPHVDLLKDTTSTIVVDENDLRRKADIIREKLEQFGIVVTMKSVHVGPTVTQFTLEPSAGVKLTKITALKRDLALALAAENLRIEAPIQGKSLVGIEIPNKNRSVVGMREILESEAWEEEKSELKLAFGRDVAGKPIVANLAKMPHLLIAGKTGSGKSVAMNAFLCSLLWQNSPEQLKLILVDPKRVELSLYNNLPHLLTPVIVEPEKCVSALAWAVAEMNRRYKMFSEAKCRDITEYNKKADKKEPFIVIVIDELADLMMVAGKDVEAAICRIAQMARAVGMHLMIATQRPSVDVVTGLIKANMASRVGFKVSSGIDSRTILDGIGAEDLLGFGDMLSLDGNTGSIQRIQGILISNEEVERITNHIKLQFPEMVANDEITNQSIEGMAKGGVLTAGTKVEGGDVDKIFEDAVDIVVETGKASASFLQRRMEIGYARAARILDQMESHGIIGPSRGAKPREVYGRKE